MEEEHCAELLKSIPQIIKYFNYDYLKEKCLEREIVFDAMIKNLEKKNFNNSSSNSNNNSSETRTEALLNKITLRGPDAYRKFIDILMDACSEILDLTQHHLMTLISTTTVKATKAKLQMPKKK